jgi:hypothetical protein
VEKVLASGLELDLDGSAICAEKGFFYLVDLGIVGAHIAQQVDECVSVGDAHNRADDTFATFGAAVNKPGLPVKLELDLDTHGV